jgi:signal transduction histidine kinase
MGAVLTFDVAVPLGVAAGVPYIAVVLVSLGLSGRRETIFFALACSVLTVIGFAASPGPGGSEIWKVIANRALALFAIWVTAGIGLQRKRADRRVKKANARLEARARELAEATAALTAEVAERKQAEQTLHGQIAERKRAERALATRVEQQEVVTRLGLRALEGVSLETLFRESVEALSGTLEIEYAKLLELLPGERELRLVAGVGWSPELIGEATIEASPDSQAGYALSSEQPVIVKDLSSDPRFKGPHLMYRQGVVSGMSVIVHGGERPYGVVSVHSREKREFTDEDVLFLQSVANVLALAVRRQKTAQALRESERRAHAAEEIAAIGTLASGLAHEIGNPMNIILGYAQMLEAALTDERSRERARLIGEQTQRVAKLIQTLLNVARPRETTHIPLQLPDVVEESLGFVREKLRKRGISVERDFENAPAIRGDPAKLQQLFLNLFVNAADAMPDGGTLRVSLCCLDPDEVEIRVSDTGVGISSETVNKIFEPFHTTKPAGEGSGLGLTVSKNIALEHNGRIAVSSRIGEGTEFRILFPTDSAA